MPYKVIRLKELRVPKRLIQVVREPLVQFLLIGALIYGAYSLYGLADEIADEKIVIVDTNRIESFIGQWQSRWKRPPTKSELDGIINAYIEEEVLYRQAVAIGLNKDDPITRRRIAQKLVFLTKNIALLKEPEDGELERYFNDNLKEYRQPDQVSFIQIFIDPDKRDKTTLVDAKTLLAKLKVAGIPNAKTANMGDRFMQENQFSEISELGIRRLFGGGFSESVMKLEPDKWHGPVLSGFGVHLVYVFEHKIAPSPDFAKVRDKVLADWQSGQQEKFNADFIANLNSTYEIVIAEIPEDKILRPNKEAELGAGINASTKAAQ
jgi:peptidyl-prolyl cis-trans isomerase C